MQVLDVADDFLHHELLIEARRRLLAMPEVEIGELDPGQALRRVHGRAWW
jgi:hypothetical protein